MDSWRGIRLRDEKAAVPLVHGTAAWFVVGLLGCFIGRERVAALSSRCGRSRPPVGRPCGRIRPGGGGGGGGAGGSGAVGGRWEAARGHRDRRRGVLFWRLR